MLAADDVLHERHTQRITTIVVVVVVGSGKEVRIVCMHGHTYTHNGKLRGSFTFYHCDFYRGAVNGCNVLETV